MAETTDVPELSAADRERFDLKVRRGMENDCWPWVGQCDAGGRPSFVTSRSAGQRRISARRLMWAMRNEGSARGQYVLSSCKNPQCMNPKHLYLSPVSDGVTSTGKRAAARESRDRAFRASAPPPAPVPERRGLTSSLAGFGAIESFDTLDSLNDSDAEAIRSEVRAAELRAQTLRALLNLAVSRPAPRVSAAAVSPPQKPAPVKKLVLQKPVAKKRAAKVPQPEPVREPGEMVRRLMFMLRDRAERKPADLAAAIGTSDVKVRVIAGANPEWFGHDAHGVWITDAGVAWCLQQEAGRA